MFPYTEKGRHLLQANSIQNAVDAVKESNDAEPETVSEASPNANETPKGKGGKKNKNNQQKKENKSEKENNKKTYHIEQPPITNKDSPYIYELYGVVIHSGGAYGGHYHAYIRDVNFKGEAPKFEPEDPSYKKILEEVGLSEGNYLELSHDSSGVWYDFDDSSVKCIPTERLASQYGGNRECACNISSFM